MEVYTWEPVKFGLYKEVVFIYRWSLEQVSLQYLYTKILYFHIGNTDTLKSFLELHVHVDASVYKVMSINTLPKQGRKINQIALQSSLAQLLRAIQ